jgi:hypothetical protein
MSAVPRKAVRALQCLFQWARSVDRDAPGTGRSPEVPRDSDRDELSSSDAA